MFGMVRPRATLTLNHLIGNEEAPTECLAPYDTFFCSTHSAYYALHHAQWFSSSDINAHMSLHNQSAHFPSPTQPQLKHKADGIAGNEMLRPRGTNLRRIISEKTRNAPLPLLAIHLLLSHQAASAAAMRRRAAAATTPMMRPRDGLLAEGGGGGEMARCGGEGGGGGGAAKMGWGLGAGAGVGRKGVSNNKGRTEV